MRQGWIDEARGLLAEDFILYREMVEKMQRSQMAQDGWIQFVTPEFLEGLLATAGLLLKLNQPVLARKLLSFTQLIQAQGIVRLEPMIQAWLLELEADILRLGMFEEPSPNHMQTEYLDQLKLVDQILQAIGSSK